MYNLAWTDQPRKFLKTLPKDEALKIIKRIETLRENPRNENVIKLKGRDNEYRARQGNYRIRFWINDDVLTVLIIDIDHRKDAYKD